MVTQQPVKKGFFAKNWGWILGGVALLGVILITAAVLVYLFVLKGTAQITEIKLSAATPIYGEALKAEVTVSNSGLLTLNYHAVLNVDGSEVGAKDVVLKHNEPQTLEFDISDLKAGDHKLTMGKTDKSFKLMKPAEFKLGKITLAPDTFYVGDTVTASVDVSNAGEVKGLFKSAFTYDGLELDTQSMDIDAGESKTITAQFKVDKKGTHVVSIEDQKNTFTALNPAMISVVDVALSKPFVKPDENETVTVTLENTGDITGTYKLQLMLNDAVLESKDVSVDAGTKQLATFKVSQTKTGKYTVKAGDISKTFSVVVITRPTTGTYLVSTAKASGGSYLIVYNFYTDKDAVLVLTKYGQTKVAVSVFIRSSQNTKKIYVKTGYYSAYYTAGKNYDSATRRFVSNAVYYKLTQSGFTKLDFKKYWFRLGFGPNFSGYTSLSESQFPR